MSSLTFNKRDKEDNKKNQYRFFVLDEIEQLFGIDELISVPNISSKVVIQEPKKFNNDRKKRMRAKIVDDLFKIDLDDAKLDREEFKRQIKIQKEIYLAKIKNNTPKRNKKVHGKKSMKDIFGNLENLDQELFKKIIQEKKEDFKSNIMRGDFNSDVSHKKINPLLVQLNAEKNEMPISTIRGQDLDVFSDELQHLNIDDLRLELLRRKNHYKKYIDNQKVCEIAENLSHLEMIIKFMCSVSPEISNYKPSFIFRRIKRRIVRLKLHSLGAYLDFIKINSEEIQLFKIELSINVTQFMRDRKTWDYLESIILPQIIMTTKGKIKLWSAATAIGCEAYSLAIINHKNSNTNYEIISTDVNNDLLMKAQQGCYDYHHVKELTDSELKRYFTYHNGRYKIKSFLKKRNRFYNLNLFSDFFPKKVDIILARNVWIYFEKPELVYLKMYNSLNCNGYLVLGGTEMVPTQFKHLFKLVNVATQTYQKICN